MSRILFVCTGNICRSPTAEGVLRHVAMERGLKHVVTDSAGTHDYHIGEPPDLRTMKAAMSRGYDLSALRARQVCMQDYSDFDEILAIDRGHYERLVKIKPAGAAAKVGLFLDYLPDCGLKDVPDPYYGGPEGFEHVLDLVEQGIESFIRSIQS